MGNIGRLLIMAGVMAGVTLTGLAVNAQVGDPKNVQVLKGKSTKEIRDFMKTVSDGIGEKCVFCHNLKDYASDEKKNKLVGRELIKLVNDVNRQVATINKSVMSKSKLDEVNCYTCHHGSLEIVTAPK